MNRRYIAPLVTLLALAATSVLNIIYKVSLYKSTIRLLIVFITFYVIGKIAEKIIVTVIREDQLNQLAEAELKEKEMIQEKQEQEQQAQSQIVQEHSVLEKDEETQG